MNADFEEIALGDVNNRRRYKFVTHRYREVAWKFVNVESSGHENNFDGSGIGTLKFSHDHQEEIHILIALVYLIDYYVSEVHHVLRVDELVEKNTSGAISQTRIARCIVYHADLKAHESTNRPSSLLTHAFCYADRSYTTRLSNWKKYTRFFKNKYFYTYTPNKKRDAVKISNIFQWNKNLNKNQLYQIPRIIYKLKHNTFCYNKKIQNFLFFFFSLALFTIERREYHENKENSYDCWIKTNWRRIGIWTNQ